MVGISYSGFSQLVVAGTDPPDLAAITPLSPTDDLYSTGYPGGIYNDGFAAELDRPARLGRRSRRPAGRPAVGGGRDRHGRQDLPGQPAPPPAGRRASSRWSAPTSAGHPALFDQRSPDGVGLAHQGAGVPGRRPPGRAGGPAVARPHHRPARRQARLRDHDERHPHRLARSRHDLALAGIPRPLRRRPGADGVPDAGRAGTRRCTRRSPGAPRSAPVPAVRFTERAFGAPRPRRPSPRRTRGCGCSSTTAAAASGRARSQPTYEAGFSSWPPAGSAVHYRPRVRTARCTDRARRRAPSTASFRPDPSVRPADDLAASANAWAAQPPYDWTTVPAANGIAFETPAFTTRDHHRRAGQPEPHARSRRRPSPTCR